MAFSNRVRSALTTTVLATAATGFLAGCGSDDEQEQVAYCTNEDGNENGNGKAKGKDKKDD